MTAELAALLALVLLNAQMCAKVIKHLNYLGCLAFGQATPTLKGPRVCTALAPPASRAPERSGRNQTKPNGRRADANRSRRVGEPATHSLAPGLAPRCSSFSTDRLASRAAATRST